MPAVNRGESWAWSVTLLITCLLGVGLGLSLGYALFRQGEGALELSSAPDAVLSGPAPSQQDTPPAADDPDLSSAAISQVEAALKDQARLQDEVQTAGQDASTVPVQAVEAVEAPGVAEPEEDDIWAARHLFIAVNGQWLAEGSKKFLNELRPGGVVLRNSNLQSESQTSELVKEIKLAVGFGDGLGDLPLIAAQDEGGPYNRLGLSNAPSAQELGRSGNDERARNLGLSYARACLTRGIGVTLFPVLDVYESGTVDPGLEFRSFGTDQTVVANIGLAMVDGLRQGGVIPVVKHFPGYGASTYGSDGMLVVLNKDFSGLARVMYPFNEAVRRNVQGIVVGYVAVPALDKEDPRRPAALSPVLVTDLLRNRWGFDGVILADDVARNEFTHGRPIERTAVEALAAGCDAVMLLDANPQRIKLVCDAIEKAVRTGELTREALDKSKLRLSRWQDVLNRTSAAKPGAQAMLRAPAASGASQEERIPAPPSIPAPVQTENATASQAPVEEERAVVAKVSAIEFVAPDPKESAPADVSVPDLGKDTGMEVESSSQEVFENDGGGSDQSTPPAEVEARNDADPEPVASIEEERQAEPDATENATTLEIADTPAEAQRVEIEEIESPSQDEGTGDLKSGPASDEVVVAKAQATRAEPVPAEFAGVPANDADPLPSIPKEDVESELNAGLDEVEAPESTPYRETLEDAADPPGAAPVAPVKEEAADTIVSNEIVVPEPEQGREEMGALEEDADDKRQEETEAQLDAADSPPSTEPIEAQVIVVADAPVESRRNALQSRGDVEHTVQENELLSQVARIYGVSAADIVKWNDLQQAKLETGTKLMIYFKPEGPAEEEASRSDLTKLTFKLVRTVEPGDTVAALAKQYSVSMDDLKLWNGLGTEKLVAGRKLTIFVGAQGNPSEDAPELKTGVYEVQPGDTLNKIAREFFTTRKLLLQLNELKDPNHIFVGQKLKVPLGV